jgi:molybdenum cofactor cytidylyltransferase
MQQNCAIVVLAAGGSSRFGEAKQLADVEGQSLLTHALTQLPGKTEDIYVVLGARHQAISDALGQQYNILLNEDWQQGLSSSIRLATQILAANYSHLLFTLGDQLALRQAHFERLLEQSKSQPKHIVAAHYEQRNAVPAIFPASYYALLQSLQGDRGARLLLQQEKDRLISVDIPQARWDIDTQEDLQLWLNQRTRN